MPEKKAKKKTEPKKKNDKLEVTFVPELCHREFADGFGISIKDSGLFRLTFMIVDPQNQSKANVHTIIYMEEEAIESLARGLQNALNVYRESKKSRG